jgi:CHAD domain-containing protein
MGTAAFLIGDDDRARAVARLGVLGFEFGPPRPESRTLLDTFDGRLHRAGLRLELVETDGRELVLSGADAVTSRLPVAAPPRFQLDLPAGPFRARLAALIDVRALLPVARLAAVRTTGSWRDHADKIVAGASLFERMHVECKVSVDLPGSTIEIHEAHGYPKRAREATEVLEQLGLARLDDDTVALAAAVGGADLAGFSGSPTVALDPAMPAIDGYRAVLDNLATTVAANWQGTIDQVDPEFLHDLRVAVRRTRSVLANGRKVLPTHIIDLARAGFAKLGLLTGPARDLDVYLIEWSTYTAPLGVGAVVALAPVRTLLSQRRGAAYEVLVDALQSSEVADLMTMWRTWLAQPTRDDLRGVHADVPLGAVVAKRIARAQRNLLDHGRLIGSETPAEQVHDLRKDAKELRYLFECFGGLLSEAPRKAFVRRLKSLQDNLGEHQDAQVHVDELRAISRQLHEQGAAADTMLAIGQLAERLDQQRRAARVEFSERFEAYDTRETARAFEAAIAGLT